MKRSMTDVYISCNLQRQCSGVLRPFGKWRNVPEEWSPQPHSRENFQTSKLLQQKNLSIQNDNILSIAFPFQMFHLQFNTGNQQILVACGQQQQNSVW
jgi:hypothetical protein